MPIPDSSLSNLDQAVKLSQELAAGLEKLEAHMQVDEQFSFWNWSAVHRIRLQLKALIDGLVRQQGSKT